MKPRKHKFLKNSKAINKKSKINTNEIRPFCSNNLMLKLNWCIKRKKRNMKRK